MTSIKRSPTALAVLGMLMEEPLHPYRMQRPESLLTDLSRLKATLARYSPKRSMGIEITEMGYPISYPGQTEVRRAGYIQRSFLVSLVAGVQRFYVYQWKEKVYTGESQHGFGLYDGDLKPLPSGTAFAALAAGLRGYTFEKRVAGGSPDDYVLSFVRAGNRKYVAWTARQDPVDLAAVSRNPAKVALAAAPQASVAGRVLRLSDTPQIVAGL
jgi:hypothetical protein